MKTYITPLATLLGVALAPRKLKKAIKKLNQYRSCTTRERLRVQRWVARADRLWDRYGALVVGDLAEKVFEGGATQPVVGFLHGTNPGPEGWEHRVDRDLPKV